MNFHLGEIIKRRIATKIVVPIIAIMLLIFTLVILMTSIMTGNSMNAAGQREMRGIAEKNAAIIQGVFDSVNSTGEGKIDSSCG